MVQSQSENSFRFLPAIRLSGPRDPQRRCVPTLPTLPTVHASVSPAERGARGWRPPVREKIPSDGRRIPYHPLLIFIIVRRLIEVFIYIYLCSEGTPKRGGKKRRGDGDEKKRALIATAPGLRFTFSANPPDNIKFRKVKGKVVAIRSKHCPRPCRRKRTRPSPPPPFLLPPSTPPPPL